MGRLLLIFSIFFAAVYTLLAATSGSASIIIHDALSPAATMAIAAIFSALSVGFYTHLDGIVKDIPEKSKLKNPDSRDSAIESLQELRVEVINNAALVLILVAFSMLLYGTSNYLKQEKITREWIEWLVYSLRAACAGVSVVAALIQMKGFITATKLRSVIAKNRD